MRVNGTRRQVCLPIFHRYDEVFYRGIRAVIIKPSSSSRSVVVELFDTTRSKVIRRRVGFRFLEPVAEFQKDNY